MRIRRLLASCCLSLATAGLSHAGDDFLVQLNLKHGHLGKVFFGCQTGATDQFDRRLDIMAPPPGIATGYTAFVQPDTGMFLYQDLRAPAATITWQFKAQVFQGKPIRISWDPTKLPEHYQLRISLGETSWDMRQATHVDVPQTATLTISATKT